MSDERYHELIEKRDGPGLTDEEADELGRLEAEKAGEPYGGAEARQAAEDLEDAADQEGRRERAESSFDVRDSERTEEIEER
jgi:hypothetical protein